MKISKELASKIILESESFRQFVVDTLFKGSAQELINQVKAICGANPSNKIAAIKAVRELSRLTSESEFTDAYGVHYYDGNVLGLADSKRIVEMYL